MQELNSRDYIRHFRHNITLVLIDFFDVTDYRFLL